MAFDWRRLLQGRKVANYDGEFFDGVGDSSVRSAETVVPQVIDLVGQPASVVDVGCGVAAWLSVFATSGVEDILGLDGDYVRRDQLKIGAEHFRPTDLRRPFAVDRAFDLVVCLEVAEHLPDARAEGFVADLCALGDTILFSAAIPFQGGVGHINEQWPDYWRERFESHGYVGLDALRSQLWDDASVDSWFAQNLVVYATKARVEGDTRLRAELERTGGRIPALVHPRTYASKARVATAIMDAMPRPVLDALRRRLKVET